MINVGIVGLGFMAAMHIRAYRRIEGVQVKAICDKDTRRLNGDFSGVSGNLGVQDPVRLDMSTVAAYSEFEEMIGRPEIDLIDVCTPTASHVVLATAALQAGKHVLCEKPMARNSEQARQIVAAAEDAKGFFMPSMCMRFWPEWAWLREQIHGGAYGRLLSLRISRLSEPPGWGQEVYLNGKVSGGALFDLHVHDVDFIQYCCGRPKAVFSSGFSKVSGAIDHVLTQYEVHGGAVVSAEGSWAMTSGFGFQMTYLALFERATAEFDSRRGESPLRLCEAGKEPVFKRCDGPPDGYVGELQHMVEAIQNQTPPSVVTASDGLSAVQTCEAEEQSIQSGKPVMI